MIINETVSSPVITSVTSAPSRFKIKASAKAFKILSGFYSEPILAIPRELGANAWDSHVKAGNTDKMFEVHAPNTLEPWFSIRDFGTGLSPEAIDTIYTTYFESTKTSDNDSDGCMGLGSKTPFNYTENFTVISWHCGMKHVYNCFIDESGSPNIMRMASELSKDPNGVEVKFGVKIADIGMWVDKITRAYQPFRFRPTIKGAKIEYKPREYIYEGKGWALRKNERDYYTRTCNAFMGNYCYPINMPAMSSLLSSTNPQTYNRINSALSNRGFDLFFNIGDLEVAPNKEQLQYDDNNRTGKAIIAAMENAVNELEKMVQKNIEVPKTRWEAMQLYNKYNGYESEFSHVRHIIGDIPIMFNGTKVSAGSENVSTIHSRSNLNSQNSILPTFLLYSFNNRSNKIERTSSYRPNDAGVPTLIFYTGESSIKKARVRHYINTHHAAGKFPCVYIVQDLSDKFTTILSHQKYFGWDGSSMKNIESLPKPPPTPRAARTTQADEINYASLTDIIDFCSKTNKNGSYGPSVYVNVYWGKKSEKIVGTETYYYVDFYYSNPSWNGKEIEAFIDGIIKYFVEKKLNNGAAVIYGINAKNKNVIKVGNWVNIIDIVKTDYEKHREEHENYLYWREAILTDSIDNLRSIHSQLTTNPSIVKSITNQQTRSLFMDFVKYYTNAQTFISSNNPAILNIFGFKAKMHKDFGFDFNAFKKVLKEKYMGVFDICRGAYISDSSPITRIINFIDEKS
jgi:hypothetical protein